MSIFTNRTIYNFEVSISVEGPQTEILKTLITNVVACVSLGKSLNIFKLNMKLAIVIANVIICLKIISS